MSLKREPVLYIGAGIVILQIIQAFLNGEPISATLVDSAVTAIGAIFARKVVTPTREPRVPYGTPIRHTTKRGKTL